MELTRRHIEIFRTDGFLVIRNLLPVDQVDEINVGYQKAISGKIDVHDWKKRINSVPIAQLGDPSAVLGWRKFPYFQKILSIAKQLNGEDLEVAYDQLIYKPRIVQLKSCGTRMRVMVLGLRRQSNVG